MPIIEGYKALQQKQNQNQNQLIIITPNTKIVVDNPYGSVPTPTPIKRILDPEPPRERDGGASSPQSPESPFQIAEDDENYIYNKISRFQSKM